MKNNKTKNLVFILLLIFLSCKKKSENHGKIIPLQKIDQNSIKDTLIVEIDDNYILKTNSGNKKEKIDFFKPIKHKLIDESFYAQVLYDKKNVIINLEIGQNADIYEDIYLSKSQPIRLEKIVRTSIIKTDVNPEKTKCEEVINTPITSISRYRTIDEKREKCKTEKMK